MGNCFSSKREGNGDLKSKRQPGIAYTIGESDEDEVTTLQIQQSRTSGRISVTPSIPIGTIPKSPPHETDNAFVQRIASEIAEFREQLRRGQEQIQAMNTSVQSFDTTKSCPGLVEIKETQTVLSSVIGFNEGVPNINGYESVSTSTVAQIKRKTINASTQTDSRTSESIAQTSSIETGFYQSIDDQESFQDFMDPELDFDDDDNRYRLRGCEALSVIEESEHESSLELSPSLSTKRKMSNTSETRTRPKLIRMRNTIDDPPPSFIDEDEQSIIKSDIEEYLSAASSLSASKNPSLYNSLERPLQLSSLASSQGKQDDALEGIGGGSGGSAGTSNGADSLSDTYSTVSGGNTTYGSPISSPSSPTYRTPSQGSSSQETLTNNHDEKTPVNFQLLDEDDPFRSDSASTLRSENTSRSSNSSKSSLKSKNRAIWKMLPIDNRQGTSSIGVIPDEDQQHMRQYAYDVITRSTNPDAAILSRNEWRVLHSDLDKIDMAKFKKTYGEDDQTNKEEPVGFSKDCLRGDLDELAESYVEKFPFLAESIFEYLDKTAQEKVESIDELPELKKRFEELSTTFRTDHEKLDGRSEIIKRERDYAREKLSEIISSVRQIAKNVSVENLSEELRDMLYSLENWITEIELYVKALDRSAKRAGRLDLSRRIFKMVEVMVLYVRILNAICKNLEEERDLAKKMLEERGIEFSPSKKAFGTVLHNNNNVHEKADRVNFLHKTRSDELREDGTDDESHILQRLLGPKKISEQYNQSFGEVSVHRRRLEKQGFLSWLGDKYEVIQREFHWPWNGEETWNIIQKGFALMLMLFGVLLICRISFIPSCESVKPYFTFNHNEPPRI